MSKKGCLSDENILTCDTSSRRMSSWSSLSQLNKDQKLLHQLDFEDHQKLTVRATSSVTTVTSVFPGQVYVTNSVTKVTSVFPGQVCVTDSVTKVTSVFPVEVCVSLSVSPV